MKLFNLLRNFKQSRNGGTAIHCTCYHLKHTFTNVSKPVPNKSFSFDIAIALYWWLNIFPPHCVVDAKYQLYVKEFKLDNLVSIHRSFWYENCCCPKFFCYSHSTARGTTFNWEEKNGVYCALKIFPVIGPLTGNGVVAHNGEYDALV